MTDQLIPIVKPTLLGWDEVIREFRQAWESGMVSTSTFTRRFEAAVEEKIGVAQAVMVQSCTAGLMLVLRALELKGEVILPAFTWTSTAHACIWNGLTPVFADIRPGTYTLDPEAVASSITRRTVVVMPVNVFGCPPDYEAFAELAAHNRLVLIYDSAQGLGSRYRMVDGSWHWAGKFGTAEVFSLSPTKVISAMEGGLITTNNIELGEKLRQLRDYGKTIDGDDIAGLGLSARVPEINAIVAYNNFLHLEELVQRRLDLMAAYRQGLADLPGVKFQEIPADRISSGNYCTIFIDSQEAKADRNQVYQALKDKGIQAKKYFYPALHLQQVYRELGRPYIGRLPLTEAAASQGLALPMFSHMRAEQLEAVIDALRLVLS